MSSRLTFAYLEHCRITIRDGAVAATMVTCDHTCEQGFHIRREGGDRIHTTDMDGITLMGINPKPRKEDGHGDDDDGGMNDRRSEHPSNMY